VLAIICDDHTQPLFRRYIFTHHKHSVLNAPLAQCVWLIAVRLPIHNAKGGSALSCMPSLLGRVKKKGNGSLLLYLLY
jgi:hypothetical protein